MGKGSVIVIEGEVGQVSDSDVIKGVEPFTAWAEKYSIVQNMLKPPVCAWRTMGTGLYRGKRDSRRSEVRQREIFQYACPAPSMGGERQ